MKIQEKLEEQLLPILNKEIAQPWFDLLNKKEIYKDWMICQNMLLENNLLKE